MHVQLRTPGPAPPNTMKTNFVALLFSASVVTVSVAVADTWVGTTSTSWNTDGNWQDGTKPTVGEAVVFNASSTLNLSSSLDGAFSVSGITVGDPAGTTTLFITSGTGGSLTLGSGGIDMSAAGDNNLTFTSTVAIGSPQSWNIAAGRTLSFALASNTTFNMAGVTKSGSGNLLLEGVNVGGGTLTLSGGTISMRGTGSKVSGIAAGATVSVGGGTTLSVRRSTGDFNLAGTIRLDGGTWSMSADTSLPATLNGTLDVTANGGTFSILQSSSGSHTQSFNGTLTGTGSLSLKNEATVVGSLLALGGNNAGFTGTANINGTVGNRIVRLTNANSGSDSASWVVATGNTLQIDGVSLLLGDLTGTGTVTTSTGTGTITVGGKGASGSFSGVISGSTHVVKTGSGIWTLDGVGANNYTGTTAINQGTLVTGKTTALGTGAVTVGGGTLRVGAGGLTGIASLTINSGVLDSATAASDISTTGAFTMSGGTWLLRATADGVTAGSFSLTGGTIDLGLLSLSDKQTSGFSLISGSGTASGLTFTGGVAGFDYAVDANGDLVVSAIPEPATYGLMAAGVLASASFVRRRRKQAVAVA